MSTVIDVSQIERKKLEQLYLNTTKELQDIHDLLTLLDQEVNRGLSFVRMYSTLLTQQQQITQLTNYINSQSVPTNKDSKTVAVDEDSQEDN